jgi:tRNA(fMet)-specific endonuclease VapC
MKILDSTYLIDYIQGKKETVAIRNGSETLLTTQINLYEVIRGLFWKKISPEIFHQIIDAIGDIRVLQLDDQAIIRSAEISAELMKKGGYVPDSDCMTAGIALSNGINKIVTRNVKHFKRIKGIIVETY